MGNLQQYNSNKRNFPMNARIMEKQNTKITKIPLSILLNISTEFPMISYSGFLKTIS